MQGVRTPLYPPEKSQKNIRFLSNTGPDPLKSHKATKSAFNVGPTSARQRNAISIKWRIDGGPMMAQLQWYLDLLSSHKKQEKGKKRCQSSTLLLPTECNTDSVSVRRLKKYQIIQ